MSDWIVFTLLTLLMYGFWGWFPKLASLYLDPKSAWVWEAVGFGIASVLIFLVLGIKPTFNAKGALFAALTGVVGALGTFFFFIAISKYKASVVTTVTALYPIITILLSVLVLKETLSLKQAFGVVVGLASIYLITS